MLMLSVQTVWYILYCYDVIFRYVDQGKNPELYTEDCLKRALNKNEEVKSKVDAYKVLNL